MVEDDFAAGLSNGERPWKGVARTDEVEQMLLCVCIDTCSEALDRAVNERRSVEN